MLEIISKTQLLMYPLIFFPLQQNLSRSRKLRPAYLNSSLIVTLNVVVLTYVIIENQIIHRTIPLWFFVQCRKKPQFLADRIVLKRENGLL